MIPPPPPALTWPPASYLHPCRWTGHFSGIYCSKTVNYFFYQLESLICDLRKAKQNIFPSCYQSRSVAWQFWSLKCWSQRGSPEYKDLGDNKILKFCHSLRQNDVNLIKGPGSRWYNVFFCVKYVFQIKGYVYNFWWRCWNVFELK